VDDLIIKWDSHSKSLISDAEAASIIKKPNTSSSSSASSSAPSESFANAAGTEGRMMRRAIEVFTHTLKEVEAKVGVEKLTDTRLALATLIDDISAQFKV
jgi:hypothetical protein